MSILLAVIYIAFISLGLPDSLTGAAWPVMHQDLGVSISYAGILTMIISCGTIVSSLLSHKLTRKLGTGVVMIVSVFMTAVALFGFSISHSFLFLCLWAIPYGFGAGAVDAALNNFVALHMSSRHMSWLHCFWGVGASISPYIMSYFLTNGHGWNQGYGAVSLLQIILTAVLFLSLPLWKQKEGKPSIETLSAPPLSLINAVKIKGVPPVLITLFAYCALEQTTGLWASSYLVQYRGIHATTAASFASFYFLGITFGRFLSGFFADKLGDKRLIRIGVSVAMLGLLLIALPVTSHNFALAGLLIVGFGCAPIYPSIIHATPFNFGKENSQAIIGIQMASAYFGTIFMPSFFGFIASSLTMGLYPFYLFFFIFIILFMSERLNAVIKMRENKKNI